MKAIRKKVVEWCVIRKGSNRIALDLVRFGFVVKLPIVHGILFLKSLLSFRGMATTSFRRWACYPMDGGGFWGLKRILFKGIADNWREFQFSLISTHPFAQPTLFSFFGLLNIQKRGDVPVMDYWKFRRELEHLVGQELFYLDSHHMASMDNFCVHKGRLRMVDYGSPNTRTVIRERGMCVYLNFQVKEPT